LRVPSLRQPGYSRSQSPLRGGYPPRSLMRERVERGVLERLLQHWRGGERRMLPKTTVGVDVVVERLQLGQVRPLERPVPEEAFAAAPRVEGVLVLSQFVAPMAQTFKRGGGRGTRCRVGGQAVQCQSGQPERQTAQVRRRTERVGPAVREVPGDRLDDEQPQREHVTGRCDPPTQNLLRRPPVVRAHPQLGQLTVASERHCSQIEDRGTVARSDHDVRRFEIAVRPAELVYRHQSGRDVAQHVQRCAQRQLNVLALQPHLQRHTHDPLVGDPGRNRGGVPVDRAGYKGRLQRVRRLQLTLKPQPRV
jgi:hypothetical protein